MLSRVDTYFSRLHSEKIQSLNKEYNIRDAFQFKKKNIYIYQLI